MPIDYIITYAIDNKYTLYELTLKIDQLLYLSFCNQKGSPFWKFSKKPWPLKWFTFYLENGPNKYIFLCFFLKVDTFTGLLNHHEINKYLSILIFKNVDLFTYLGKSWWHPWDSNRHALWIWIQEDPSSVCKHEQT